MQRFEFQTKFIYLWWGRKRQCFKHKNTVGMQIFVCRSSRTLNIMCLISPISCWHVTRATRSGWWMRNKAFIILYLPWFFVGIFSDYGCLNTEKFAPLTDSDVQTLIEGKKPKYVEKTESCVFSSFGNDISRDWERKLINGIFATGRFWLCTWKTSSIAKDKFSNWEFCLFKLGPLLFLQIFNAFFILSLSVNTLYNF